MPKHVSVLVVRTAGTNCNEETAFAFSHLGAKVAQVHIKALVNGEVKLDDFHILALPGGFSYGDDIASGRILANEIRLKLGPQIAKFIKAGKLVIGICNGFQILVKAGILPGNNNQANLPKPNANAIGLRQEATLVHNDSAKFEARWVHLSVDGKQCVWTKDMPGRVYLPVAHGEGKFIPGSKALLKQLNDNGQIVLRYCAPDGTTPAYPQNPNGSTDHIAGICDPTGRVLGLMPHPERHFLFEQHPYWTRLKLKSTLGEGAAIFENGVRYVKDHLL